MDPYESAMVSRCDPALHSDDVRWRVVFYDRRTRKSGGATAWEEMDRRDSSISITVAEFLGHLITAQPDWQGDPTELTWYAVATDSIYETTSTDTLADGSRGFRIHVNAGVTAAGDPPAATLTSLEQNSPNPFRNSTRIRFSTAEAGHVTLTVHDLTGRRIATLIDEPRHAGSHTVRFDAADLAGGVYLCRLEAGGNVHTQRMVIQK